MKHIRPALTLLLTFGILTGIIYPLLITCLAQLIFPDQANGSLVLQNGQTVGSQWIGQQFDQPKYFWGRLSATAGSAYNASVSGGSNYSVLNPALQDAVKARLSALHQADPQNTQPVPVDLVTASASGLDPHISVAAAAYQAGRVARQRGLTLEQVNALIKENTRGRIFVLLGEETVNVLALNLALDKLQ
jgi:potassium-transporting ATPase KdpC subunit